MTFALLLSAAFTAGFIDAIAGGGGLVQLPAVLLSLPTLPLSVAFGTNKCSSVFGTLAAIPQYAMHVRYERTFLCCALPAAFVASYAGAYGIASLDARGFANALLKPLILVLLTAVGIYTCLKKNFGQPDQTAAAKQQSNARAAVISGGIGFYDGFFGPGTGSFLIYALVRYMGFDFLKATAYAKAINAATNFGALAYFIPNHSVLYSAALPMAAFNVAGSILGARLAILRGNRFVRLIFLIIIFAVIARLGCDVWKGLHAPD